MKSYFIVENLLQTIFSCNYVTFFVQRYEIDGVEARTPDYISQNPMIFRNVLDYFPSKTLYTGIPYQPDNVNPNHFNPFVEHFKLLFPQTNGIPFGYPTATSTGSNYGGMMNIGTDKPIIYNGHKQPYGWAFFIDIDYTKRLRFQMSIIAYANSQGEEPLLDKTFYIEHSPGECLSKYVIRDNNTSTQMEFNHLGFLNGLNPDQIYDAGIPIFGVYVPPENLEIANVYAEKDCGGGIIDDGCTLRERTRSYAIKVGMPKRSFGFDEQFKECCYKHIVLADLQSTDDYRNDYSSFYYQRKGVGDNCTFILKNKRSNEEIILDDNTFGRFFNFGSFSSNPKLKGFLVEWRKVLQNLGKGEYQIIKRISFLGSVTDQLSITFSLRQYTDKIADKTVRMDIVTNGWLESDKVMFKGTDWKHSLRVPGFFGRREPKYEEDILIRRNYRKEQISMKQTNEYKFQTNMIPDCVTNEIWDFMLYANEIYMNDYNLNNHSHQYRKFEVKFVQNDNSDYFVNSRKARLNLTFSDRLENNIKRNY